MNTNKKFYILTLGCQMNKNDSERIAGFLSDFGLENTDKPEEADVLLINTCSVRAHAEQRIFGFVHNWNEFRKNKPNLIIGITGCLPGYDRDGKIKKRFEKVDLYFPITDLPKLSEKLSQLNPELFSVEKNKQLTEYWEYEPMRPNNFLASITIQNGCDNFCTYCIVPYSRGREKNRPLKEILTEIKKLDKEKYPEIDLLGQVVNNYQAPDPENFSPSNPYKTKDDFAALLWEVNQIKGVDRIFFTAPDPQYFNDFQIEALTLPKMMNYLHIPVQSGDNQVLQRMNRKYTREYFIDLIQKIRQAKPGITIGTDIIVGFCGETEAQFQNTLDLYQQCDFDISYHAKYSTRPGTVADKLFVDDVSEEIKRERWDRIQKIMEKRTWEKNQIYQDKVVSVLVAKCEGNFCQGNSREMKLVQFVGDESLLGRIVQVKIDRPERWILFGGVV